MHEESLVLLPCAAEDVCADAVCRIKLDKKIAAMTTTMRMHRLQFLWERAESPSVRSESLMTHKRPGRVVDQYAQRMRSPALAHPGQA